MGTELEPESRPEASLAVPSAGPMSMGGLLLYWLPVLVALAVFAQVAMLGLRPALAEERRLAESTQVLLERTAATQEEAQRLGRLLRAQQDPVFLERERRALQLAPGAPGEPR